MVTDKIIAFSKMNDEFIIDRIPLSEIISIQANGETWTPDSRSAPTPPQNIVVPFFGANTSSTVVIDKAPHTFEIYTEQSGYNSGNTYYLQANSDQELANLLPRLKSMIAAAVRKTKQITIGARVHLAIKSFFGSYYFQFFIAIMIILVLRRPLMICCAILS